MQKPSFPAPGVRHKLLNLELNNLADYSDFAAGPGLHFAPTYPQPAGLLWGYRAGRVLDGATVTEVAAGQIALTGNATNYVEVTTGGVVSANTSGFTAGRIPLRILVTDAGSVTSSSDKRPIGAGTGGDGSSILYGAGAPDNGNGSDGDTYVDTSSGALYSKAGGEWAFEINITGPPGVPGGALNPRGEWFDGEDYEPQDDVQNGTPVSSYYCIAAHTADADNEPGIGVDWEDYWVLYAEGLEGPEGDPGDPGADGADGSQIFNGSGAPVGGTGVNGDWYFRSNGDVHKKVSDAWAFQFNIKGVGVPTGGSTDDSLVKSSGTDYATTWSPRAAKVLTTPGSTTPTTLRRTATMPDAGDMGEHTIATVVDGFIEYLAKNLEGRGGSSDYLVRDRVDANDNGDGGIGDRFLAGDGETVHNAWYLLKDLLELRKAISYHALASIETPPSGQVAHGVKTDNIAYLKQSDGTETALNGSGKLSKSVAGSSDVTLTAAESLNGNIELTGVLTGNISVIVPTAKRMWRFYNATSGAFSLTVKTAAGTGIAVTQGSAALLESNGTNVVEISTGGGGASALDDLTDVVITGAASGEVLKYNGSEWVNDTDSTGGGASVTPTQIALTAQMFS